MNKNQDLGIISQLNQQLRRLRKLEPEERFIAAFNTYQASLREYLENYLQNFKMSLSGIPYSQASQYCAMEHEAYRLFGFLQDPYRFALNKNLEIYYIYNVHFAFQQDTYNTVFQQFGFLIPPLNLINNLYQLLLLRRENGPYWNYIHYKRVNNCSLCIFDDPGYFYLFEENIFFSTRNSRYVLLEKRTYKLPVEVNNALVRNSNRSISLSTLRQPTPQQFKSIMTFIKEYIDEENHLSIIKHPDQVLMQYIVHHLQSKHDKVLSISVNQDYIRGLQAQASLSRPGDYKGKHIFEEQQYFFRKKQGNVSGELIDYFLALTGGDLKVIDQWAKTIARINLLKTNSDSIAPKITVILTPHTKLVSAWLASIYLDKGIKVTSTIPKLYRQKLSEALDFKLSGGILKIVENCGNLTSEHLKRLGKMARSIPIKQKDSAVGKLTYISNCHYLLFAKDQKEVNIYQSYFRQLADVIVCKSEFPFPDYSYDNDKFFSEWDFNWLRTVFSTYGLLLLTNDNLVYQSKSKPIEDTQQIINNFIKECCITSTEVDCYDDELYAAYTQYFLRKYGIKPIKRIHLINHLTATGKYLHCRPRHSAKDNRWGLKGISLKKDGLKQDEVTQDDAQIKKENLLKQINKINEIIFPLLELGPTVETETEKQSDKSASDAQY